MIYRPDIKPPMWGPPEAVQWAVRHNAERMGLPVPVVFIAPEFNRSVDPIIGSIGSPTISGSLSYSNRGLEFSGSSYLYWDDSLLSDAPVTILEHSVRTSGVIWSALQTVSSWTGIYKDTEIKTTKGNSFDGTILSNSEFSVSTFASANNFYGHNKNTYDQDFSCQDPGFSTTQLCFGASKRNITDNKGSGFVGFWCGFNAEISVDKQRELIAQPYVLLMPVARPFIFDVGAGGTIYTQSLSGNFPAGSGELFRDTVFTQSVEGTFPSGSGNISKQISKNLIGILPSASGSISKLISKSTEGSFPSSSGGVNKHSTKSTTGNFPAGEGTAQRKFATSKSTEGDFPAGSGSVSRILNPVVSVIVKAVKLLGSSFKKFLQG